VRPHATSIALILATACTAASNDDAVPSPVPVAAKAVVDELHAARRSQAEVQARQLLSAVQMHILQTGACPADVQAMAAAKVIDKAPRDPWDHDYVLECRDAGASVIVVSLGPDGRRHGDDDVLVETHEF